MTGDLLRRQVEAIQRAAGRLQGRGGHMEVSSGGVEAAMAEQDLDGPQVGAALQQVGREAVPERVHGHVLVQPRGAARRLAGFIHGLSVSGRPGTFPGKSQGLGW